jgi:hypothetical protein
MIEQEKDKETISSGHSTPKKILFFEPKELG